MTLEACVMTQVEGMARAQGVTISHVLRDLVDAGLAQQTSGKLTPSQARAIVEEMTNPAGRKS